MKDCIVRPTKLPPFWPTKDNHVYVVPNDGQSQRTRGI